ncbi:MAG: hypothetical protein ACJ8HI_19390 [Massilia sp.]
MKWFMLAALAAAASLSGCASNKSNGDVVRSEETYIPLGTLIARKSPSRSDGVSIVDKQTLENDRTMGNGILNPK